MSTLCLVVAVHLPSMGIGFNGQLPWTLSQDMQRFKTITLSTASPSSINAVIMGSKTWLSIPSRFRPLKGRKNVVLSNNPNAAQVYDIPSDVIIAHSLEDALSQLSTYQEESKINIEKIFAIGGESLFKEALANERCQKIYLTEVFGDSLQSFDTFFPNIPAHRFRLSNRSQLMQEGQLSFRFSDFDLMDDGPIPSIPYASNPEEGQYLSAIRDILDHGVLRGDRTGTGTLSKFGLQMRFSLRERFPLLTTKKVFWRGIAEELFWFIKGSTDANELRDKGIHIWDGNASRAFLDSRGLTHREEGDLGPVYGFQVLVSSYISNPTCALMSYFIS
jgi:dihydrofolate reductase / thymidylate synthase